MTDSLNVIINPASSSLDVLDACRERIAAGDIDSIAIVAVRKNGGIWTGSSGPAHAQLSGDALNRARAAQRDLVRSLGDSAQNAAEHEAAVAILAILDEAAGVE